MPTGASGAAEGSEKLRGYTNSSESTALQPEVVVEREDELLHERGEESGGSGIGRGLKGAGGSRAGLPAGELHPTAVPPPST